MAEESNPITKGPIIKAIAHLESKADVVQSVDPKQILSELKKIPGTQRIGAVREAVGLATDSSQTLDAKQTQEIATKMVTMFENQGAERFGTKDPSDMSAIAADIKSKILSRIWDEAQNAGLQGQELNDYVQKQVGDFLDRAGVGGYVGGVGSKKTGRFGGSQGGDPQS